MFRLRYLLLLAAFACLAAGLWWMGSPLLGDLDDGSARIYPVAVLPSSFPFRWFEDSGGTIYVVLFTLFLGVLLLTQWMFLRPGRGWKVRLSEAGRPMKTAIAAAAFMAMMLSAGFLATLLEVVDVWADLSDRWLPIWLCTTTLWVFWAVVFYSYWQSGERFARLRTMSHWLIAGSILEFLVATGVYVFKPDKEDCWCARGSYVGLVFGATVMIWAFGPGLIFLFLGEKRYLRRS